MPNRVLLGFLIFTYACIGYFRHRYMFDFSTFKFIRYYKPNTTDYIHSLNELNTQLSPKWGNDIFLVLLLSSLSLTIIHLLFLDDRFTKFCTVFFSFLGCLLLLSFFVGIVTNNDVLAYDIPRFIKNKLLLTPYFLVFFITIKKYFIQ